MGILLTPALLIGHVPDIMDGEDVLHQLLQLLHHIRLAKPYAAKTLALIPTVGDVRVETDKKSTSMVLFAYIKGILN
jgi:hypothetical protein